MTVKFKPEFLERMLQGVPGIARDEDGKALMSFDCIRLSIANGEVTATFSLAGNDMATLHGFARFNPGDTITLSGINGSMGVSLSA